MNRILALTRNFWRYRHLMLQMTVQEIKGQFAGSAVGVLWSVVNPLLSFFVYLFVFVYIFKMRAPEYGGNSGFALYLMAGLFPWAAFAEGFLRSTSSILHAAPLIQKSVFPSEVLIGKSVLSGFVANGVAIVILILFVIVDRGNFWALLLVPALVLVQIIFSVGMGFLTAAISPFFRDVIQMVDVVVRFWIFMTPILYPISALPDWAQTLMWLNPFHPLVYLYHDAFLLGRIESIPALGATLGWTIFFYVSGAFVFSKLKDEFADWV